MTRKAFSSIKLSIKGLGSILMYKISFKTCYSAAREQTLNIQLS